MDRIRELFFEHPAKKFTVREITRKTRIPKSTVKNYLDILKSDGMVTKDNQSENSSLFKIKKTNYYVEKLVETELIDYLADKLIPEAIILFGSVRKGESIKNSDIDLFIITHSKKEVNLTKFEKKLKHKVELHVETSLSKLSPTLLNNVVNGIKIYGSFRVK